MAIHSACCEEIRNTFFFGKKNTSEFETSKTEILHDWKSLW